MSNDSQNSDALPKIGYVYSNETLPSPARPKSTGETTNDAKRLKTADLFGSAQVGTSRYQQTSREFYERDNDDTASKPLRSDPTERLKDAARVLLNEEDGELFEMGLMLNISILTADDIPALIERYRHAPTPEARAILLETIGTIESLAVLPILFEASVDSETLIQDSAYAALNHLCNAAQRIPSRYEDSATELTGLFDALVAFVMDTTHPDAQREVALGLLITNTNFDFDRDFDKFKAMTLHSDSRVRGAALSLISELMNPRRRRFTNDESANASTEARVAEALTRLIQDPAPEVCMLALQRTADFVTNNGRLDAPHEEAVLRVLQSPDAPIGVRGAALEVLSELHLAEHLPLLIACLRDPHPQIRAFAASIVGTYTEPEVEGALRPLLKDDDLNVRLVVLGVLAFLMPKQGDASDIEQALEALVAHPSPQVRAFIAAHPYTPTHLTATLITDRDSTVRSNAVSVETDISLLLKAISSDPNDTVRVNAFEQLNKQMYYSKPPTDTLLYTMRDVLYQEKSAEVRAKALSFVGRDITRESTLFPEYLDLMLTLIMKDATPEIQLAAYNQLNKSRLLTPQEVVALALHLLDTHASDPESRLLSFLVATLTEYVTHDAALDTLIGLTQHANHDVRRLAANTIAEKGTVALEMPRVIPALVSGLGLEDWPSKIVQPLMMRALLGRIHESDLATLRDLLRTADDDSVKTAAAAVLVCANDLTCWREIVALNPEIRILKEGKASAFETVQQILSKPNPVPDLLPLTEFNPEDGQQLVTAIVSAITLATLGERETAAATLARVLQVGDISSDTIIDWPLLNILARMEIPQATDAASEAFLLRIFKAGLNLKTNQWKPNTTTTNVTQERETLFAWMDAALGEAAQSVYLKLLTQPAPPTPPAPKSFGGFGRPASSTSATKPPDLRIAALERLHAVDDAVLLPMLRSLLMGTERRQFQGFGTPPQIVVDPPEPALVTAVVELLMSRPTLERVQFLFEVSTGGLTSKVIDWLNGWALFTVPNLESFAPYLQFDADNPDSFEKAFVLTQMLMFAGDWRYLPQYFAVLHRLAVEDELSSDSESEKTIIALDAQVREIETLLAGENPADALLARLPTLEVMRDTAIFNEFSEDDGITLLMTLATLAYLQDARVLPYVEAMLQSPEFTSDSETRFLLNSLKQSPHPEAQALYQTYHVPLTEDEADSPAPADAPTAAPEPDDESLAVFKERLKDASQREIQYVALPAEPEADTEAVVVAPPEALKYTQPQRPYSRSQGRPRETSDE